MSKVAKDSSLGFIKRVVLVIFKAISKSTLHLISVLIISHAIAPSTAALTPVPIPSLKTIVSLPSSVSKHL